MNNMITILAECIVLQLIMVMIFKSSWTAFEKNSKLFNYRGKVFSLVVGYDGKLSSILFLLAHDQFQCIHSLLAYDVRLSMQHNVIIISYKNMSCCTVLLSYIIQDTYCVICDKIRIFIFLENPLPWWPSR